MFKPCKKRRLAARLAAAILLAAMLLVMAAACNSKANGDSDATGGDNNTTLGENTETTLSPEEERRNTPDSLPEKDLGGREFTILCHEMLINEFVAESETGETVNDAVYRRNAAVEERFNVKLNMLQIPGTWNDRTSFTNTVKKSVNAGESTYDLVAGVTSYIPALITEGIFMDINKINHLDFVKPWWGENLIKELSIGDKLYLVTGDIALSMWDCIFVMYFNKQVEQDNSLPNMYEMVKNDEWTYDKFLEISKLVSRDVDGNNKFDKEDMFGFVTTTGTVANAFSAAFDLKITSKDDENVPYPDLDTAKWAEVVEKLDELHYRLPSSLTLNDGTDNETTLINMLQDNRALFFPQTLSVSRRLRAMEADFGILPFPKYNAEQSSYYTAVRNAMSLIGVPVTVSSSDDCGLIMEALGAESYRNLVPAYYEITLKSKLARDQESGEMLDIIRENLWMNFGYSYSLSTGSIGNYLREMIEKKSAAFISTYESTFPKKLAEYEKFMTAVLEKAP